MTIVSSAVVWQEFRYSRKARYTEALSYFYQIFLETKGLDLASVESPAGVRDKCRLIINRLAAAFTLITGTKCSVCIKVIETGPEDLALPPLAVVRPAVYTLCRDDTSVNRDREGHPDERWINDLEDPGRLKHYIDDNTDFEEIMKQQARPESFFFSNNLPRLAYYKNSSFKIYGQPGGGFLLARDLSWPLPYKSAVVTPICKMTLNHKYDLDGFLCVDSRSRQVFRRQYDIELLRAVADCLHPLVSRYNQIIQDMRL